MAQKLLSIIVPIQNEAEGIHDFVVKSLIPIVNSLTKYNYEIILVDDGSTDHTLDILQNLSAEHENIVTLSLSRNFGKEPALSAGLAYAKGDAALTIDADGQHPPELIPKFIAEWEQGAEIVTGVHSHYTKHGLVQRLGSKLFYTLLHLMGNKNTVPGSTDFRLIDRIVINEFNQLSEHGRITRGLIDWLGFKQTYIKYVCGARTSGTPSYSFKKLFHLAIDSFVSMSTTPLVIFSYLGSFITIGSFALGVFCVINQHILGDPLQLAWNGSVQLAIFITFLIGLLMISQGITALYISHIHAEAQGRPLYVINRKESRNLK